MLKNGTFFLSGNALTITTEVTLQKILKNPKNNASAPKVILTNSILHITKKNDVMNVVHMLSRDVVK